MGASDNIHRGKSTFMVELMVCYNTICTQYTDFLLLLMF